MQIIGHFSDPETGESHTLDSPCLAAQQAASSRPEAHMPLCTTSGLYQRKQCHYLIDLTSYKEACEPQAGWRQPVAPPNMASRGPDEKPRPQLRPRHAVYDPVTQYTFQSRSIGVLINAYNDGLPNPRALPLFGSPFLQTLPFVPQCTDDGKYQKRQCHGSTGYCWCVNEDGAEVDGTRKGPGEGPVECEEGKYAKPTGPCHVALARTRPLLGAYVPQCTDDGKYQKRQCHGSTGYCWCVNEDGAEVDGTRKGPSEGP
ncbi:hypothetical protein NP493_4360g00001, partial [Ridgeia piscesae]